MVIQKMTFVGHVLHIRTHIEPKRNYTRIARHNLDEVA